MIVQNPLVSQYQLNLRQRCPTTLPLFSQAGASGLCPKDYFWPEPPSRASASTRRLVSGSLGNQQALHLLSLNRAVGFVAGSSFSSHLAFPFCTSKILISSKPLWLGLDFGEKGGNLGREGLSFRGDIIAVMFERVSKSERAGRATWVKSCSVCSKFFVLVVVRIR